MPKTSQPKSAMVLSERQRNAVIGRLVGHFHSDSDNRGAASKAIEAARLAREQANRDEKAARHTILESGRKALMGCVAALTHVAPVTAEDFTKQWAPQVARTLRASGRYALEGNSVPSTVSKFSALVVAVTHGTRPTENETLGAFLVRAREVKKAKGGNAKGAGRPKGSAKQSAKGAGKGADTPAVTPMQAALILTGGNAPRAKVAVLILHENNGHAAAFDVWAAEQLSRKAS